MLYLTHTHTQPAEVSAEETVWCYDSAKLPVYCHCPWHCDTLLGTRRDREREQDLCWPPFAGHCHIRGNWPSSKLLPLQPSGRAERTAGFKAGFVPVLLSASQGSSPKESLGSTRSDPAAALLAQVCSLPRK